MPWPEIEILDDSHGCPRVELAQEVQNKLYESVYESVSQKLSPELSPELSDSTNLTNLPNSHRDIHNTIRWHISLTHDGSVQNNTAVASAVAILEIL